MRRHALFIGVLVLIAAARFAILLMSQTHVHSDEAIIGLMGKHILEGRYFPFYMYGQAYNAGAAWEAYLAAMAFVLFGVSVISLKSCIVALSLVGLFLFYRMCLALYEERTALLATIVFAVAPSLLKWHFQVRGYSWYFLSIPLLTILFLSIQSTPNRRWPLFLLFGATSGLSIWSLELGISFNLALWILILMRRSLSLKNALVALAGFIAGYSPAIVFNLTHHFANWNSVLEKTGGGGVTGLYHPETLSQIFVTEMPKFFGVDTVLWYYPEKPAAGSYFTRSRCWRQALRPGHSSDRRQKLWRQFAVVSHVVMTSEIAFAAPDIGMLCSVRYRACPSVRVFFGRFSFCSSLADCWHAALLLQHAASVRRCRNPCGRGNCGRCGESRHGAPQSN
jgi:Predicted membrane protein